MKNEFTDGVRGIVLLYRTKDGETGNAQRKSIKKISRNSEEWHQVVTEFKALQKTSYPLHRIYSSVNPRNIEKAIHLFKIRQLEIDYHNSDQREWFYYDLQNRFFSCLMSPSCKEQNNFIIDCDTEEEYQDAIEKIPEDLIIYDYPTKNGRHLVTKPFNPNEIQVPIKKDHLIYIG